MHKNTPGADLPLSEELARLWETALNPQPALKNRPAGKPRPSQAADDTGIDPYDFHND